MNKYEEFKSQYKQSDGNPGDTGWKEIIRKSGQLRKSLIATKLILGITVGVLIFFFIYISAGEVRAVSFALLTMIGVLVLRVILEFISLLWLNRLGYSLDYTHFRAKADRYHRFRRWIQFLITPVLYFVYIGGFISLLPYFEMELSTGFYRYIIISGILVFVVLAVIIGIQIFKELRLLKSWNENI